MFRSAESVRAGHPDKLADSQPDSETLQGRGGQEASAETTGLVVSIPAWKTLPDKK